MRIQLAPHTVREVWLFASAQPDTLVDIESGFERKVQARLAHASQTSDPAALATGWRERAAWIGEQGPGPLGEAFTLIQLE